MIDYNEMAIFAKVVDAGSYTRAADKLGLPKSTVSRKISQLEERLGVRLLHRTTRAIKPTETGRAYYLHCAQIVAEAEEAQRAIHQFQSEPSGALRVTAPVVFGAGFLVDIVQAFLDRYPQVRMDVILDNKVLDLSRMYGPDGEIQLGADGQIPDHLLSGDGKVEDRPLVLPGVVDDGFLPIKDAGVPQVLPGAVDDGLTGLPLFTDPMGLLRQPGGGQPGALFLEEPLDPVLGTDRLPDLNPWLRLDHWS